MKAKHIFDLLLVITILGIWWSVQAHAQTVTPTTPMQLTFVGSHTSCQLSGQGQTNLCGAGDGVWLSVNGSAYFQVTAPVAVSGGVTSISINGGAAQSGAVTFKIPSQAMIPASNAVAVPLQ